MGADKAKVKKPKNTSLLAFISIGFVVDGLGIMTAIFIVTKNKSHWLK